MVFKKNHHTIIFFVLVALIILFSTPLIKKSTNNYTAKSPLKEQADISDNSKNHDNKDDIQSIVPITNPTTKDGSANDNLPPQIPVQQTSAPGRCIEGLKENYRCSDKTLLQEYQDRYCVSSWRNAKNCKYGCMNNKCQEPDSKTTCVSGFTGKYQCVEQESQKEYKSALCKTYWQKDQLCLYGCNQATGRCNSAS